VKIAITGTRGRVGGALVGFLRQAGHEVMALSRADFALDDENALRAVLEKIDVEAWINPAALSSPDACEQDAATAHKVNAVAPAIIADHCRKHDRYLLHFSTDYVFSGKDPGKRKEHDVAEPINSYGHSKREGELAVMASGARATVLRVSWVYGAKVPAFVEQCCQRIVAGEGVQAIADKWSIPTAMPDLAQWVDFLLKRQPAGVLHGCHSGEPVSWHGIAEILGQWLGSAHGGGIHATRLADATHFVAARPIHTAMDNALLSSLLPRPIPHWREAMQAMMMAR
jgi:dTDP-4-dehydrorhamnose reductase